MVCHRHSRSAFNWEDLWLTHCFAQRFGMGRNKINTCMDLTHVGFVSLLQCLIAPHLSYGVCMLVLEPHPPQ